MLRTVEQDRRATNQRLGDRPRASFCDDAVARGHELIHVRDEPLRCEHSTREHVILVRPQSFF